MHTLHLQLNDDLYKHLSSQNIDIPAKIKEYLFSLVNDSYPSISTEEAKQKVTDAVSRYKNKRGSYTTLTSDHVQEMSKYIENI
jgi:hypothetical protein